VDPLQLWGSLTQQFQQIAPVPFKDATTKTAVDVTKNMATGMAKEALKSAKAVGKKATGGGSKTPPARPQWPVKQRRAPADRRIARPGERGVCMTLFPYAHATHPQWQMAAALVLAQLRAQMALQGYCTAPTLALLYITDHYADTAQDILEHLGPSCRW
jgi:hypothetical protein